MKRNEQFLLQTVGDMSLIIPTEDACENFNGVLTVNGTGKVLWEKLKDETTEEKLLEEMLAEYDVEEAVVRKDIQSFLDALRTAKALQE